METPEHIWLVDHACKVVFGETLKTALGAALPVFTVGEISALAGDFFQSEGELIEKAYSARVFIDKHYQRGNCAGSLCISGEVSNHEAIGLSENYLSYALNNFEHFRHGLNDKNAIKAYLRWHTLAIQQRSLICEAFALHYLTDLFSSGHMRTPRGDSFEHIRYNLNYPQENAEIISGVISKICHDLDNSNGVECIFVPIDKYLQWPSYYPDDVIVYSSEFGLFLGDGHLVSSVRAAWNTSQIKHLTSMICLSIADALYGDSELCAIESKVPPQPHTVVLNYLLKIASRQSDAITAHGITDINRFLRLCLPRPVYNKTTYQGVEVPQCLMYSKQTAASANIHPSVYWRKPGTYNLLGLVNVFIETNNGEISDISIQLKYLHWIYVTMPLCMAVDCHTPVDKMHGYDARIPYMFKFADYKTKYLSVVDHGMMIEEA